MTDDNPDLYLTGYRTIPVVGWLFLLQVIAAFGLGLAVLATGGRLVIADRLAAAEGADFALGPHGPRRARQARALTGGLWSPA